MNVEAWLDAIKEAQLEGERPDGLSSEELAELWGCSRSSVNERVIKLVKLNVLKFNGRRKEMTVTGVQKMVPVYAPVNSGLTEGG